MDSSMSMLTGLGALSSPAGTIHIDPYAIKGESGTGFEKAGDLGEFECGNCLYFDAVAGACSQKDMKAFSNQPRLKDGRVQVAAEDCCEYVQRMGKKEDSHPNDDATGKY